MRILGGSRTDDIDVDSCLENLHRVAALEVPLPAQLIDLTASPRQVRVLPVGDPLAVGPAASR